MLKAMFTGIGRALASPGLVVGLWLAGFLVALPLAAVISASLHDSFGSSLVSDTMREGFDEGWYGEYRSEARGLERTFTPSLSGAGAFYENLEDLLTGGLFGGFSGLVGVGLLFALLWSFLLGGVIDRLSTFGAPQRRGHFGRMGGRFFFRFVRLAVISAVFYYLVYRLHGWTFDRLEVITRDWTVERSVLLASLVGYALIGLLLILVHISFDYAKIATVLEDRRSMLLASLRGFGFVLSHPGRTLGLYLALLLVSAAMLAGYAWIAPGAGQSTTTGVLAAFAIGQLYLLARVGMRVALLGGEVDLFQTIGAVDGVSSSTRRGR